MLRPGQLAHWYYEFEALQDLYAPSGSVAISNDKNVRVHGKNTMQLGVGPKQPVLKGMRMRFHQSMVLNIVPGDYTFSIGLAAMRPDDLSVLPDTQLVPTDRRRFVANDIDRAGSFRVMWADVPYLGLCDLPGECEMEIGSPVATALGLDGPESSAIGTTLSGVNDAAESSAAAAWPPA
jgi:hypothetical protein